MTEGLIQRRGAKGEEDGGDASATPVGTPVPVVTAAAVTPSPVKAKAKGRKKKKAVKIIIGLVSIWLLGLIAVIGVVTIWPDFLQGSFIQIIIGCDKDKPVKPVENVQILCADRPPE